jgi:hypothetical protein
VCLSLNTWTSSNQHAFLAIVAHYVSNNGQLGSYFISFIESIPCLLFTSCRRATNRFSQAHWGAFRREYGRGCLADFETIWPCWEGMFPVQPIMYLLTYSQIIAIVMDNASNNNTLMTLLESRCQQRCCFSLCCVRATLQSSLHCF